MTGLLAAQAHDEAIAVAALHLAILVVIARLGGRIARAAGQPPVLGELLAGVIAGNLALVGLPLAGEVAQDPFINVLAGFGVMVLLFEIGLESTVRDMIRVGLTSVTVAALGVGVPFALGYGVGVWLLPDRGLFVHAFLGAAMAATSIGITARVLKDMHLSGGRVARIILGAAVLDDVLGLVILAVVTGAVTAAATGGLALGPWDITWMLVKAGGFLTVSLLLGIYLSAWHLRVAAMMRWAGSLLVFTLAFAFAMAWVAHMIGLAAIIGAFAAGLILEDARYEEEGQFHTLEEQVRPISTVLAPLFFVLMGMKTDLRALSEPGVLGLAIVLILVAIAGKVASGLGVWERGVNRLAVGIGMVPRGEVGLVFAGTGLGLTIGDRPLLDPGLFSAIVLMVIVTTLVTPPALKWVLARAASKEAEAGAEAKPGSE